MDEEESRFYKKDLSEHGQIVCVEFSQFDLSQNVMLIGFQTKVLLCHLNTENAFDLELIAEFKHFSRCTSLAISPETILNILPKVLVFATAGNDFKLRIFKANLRDDESCMVLEGHSSYINDVSFDPDNAYLASASDDNSVKLWETEEFNCVATLPLTSPGVSVCWHRNDAGKLLVAEKIGVIRFYNVETQCPILSLDFGKPLTGVHWAPSDPQLVGSLHLGELLIWNLSKPCVPVNSSLLFTEAGGSVRFSPFNELIAAYNSLEGSLKVVDVVKQRLKLNVNLIIPSNVCWHFRYPVVCAADYTTICFWKVTFK